MTEVNSNLTSINAFISNLISPIEINTTLTSLSAFVSYLNSVNEVATNLTSINQLNTNFTSLNAYISFLTSINDNNSNLTSINASILNLTSTNAFFSNLTLNSPLVVDTQGNSQAILIQDGTGSCTNGIEFSGALGQPVSGALIVSDSTISTPYGLNLSRGVFTTSTAYLTVDAGVNSQPSVGLTIQATGSFANTGSCIQIQSDNAGSTVNYGINFNTGTGGQPISSSGTGIYMPITSAVGIDLLGGINSNAGLRLPLNSGSTASSHGISLQTQGGFANAGAGIYISSSVSGGTVAYGILFSTAGGQPIASTGTGFLMPITSAVGIDLTGGTFSTAAYRSPGFRVDGSGNLTALTGTFTSLTALTAIYTTLTSINAYISNLSSVNFSTTNLTSVNVVVTNLTSLTAVNTTLTSLNAYISNLTSIVEVNTNLTSLSALVSNLTCNTLVMTPGSTGLSSYGILFDSSTAGSVNGMRWGTTIGGPDLVNLYYNGTSQLRNDFDFSSRHSIGNSLIASSNFTLGTGTNNMGNTTLASITAVSGTDECHTITLTTSSTAPSSAANLWTFVYNTPFPTGSAGGRVSFSATNAGGLDTQLTGTTTGYTLKNVSTTALAANTSYTWTIMIRGF